MQRKINSEENGFNKKKYPNYPFVQNTSRLKNTNNLFSAEHSNPQNALHNI